MRKAVAFALSGVVLAACQPAVPNSAAGVGFGDYQTYLHNREAELRGQEAAVAPAAKPPVLTEQLNNGAYGASGYGATPVTSPAGMAAQAQAAAPPSDGSIGSETLAALRATSPAGGITATPTPASGSVGAPLDAMAPAPAPAAVAASVGGASGPNLAAYALAATNAPGQQVYDRGGFHLTSTTKACSKYVSPDLAQMAFLQKGGPQKDPGNLDPDGDGFACGWDPRPFQMARQ